MVIRLVRTARWTGAEICPHCLQLYVDELEVRCARCDAALCALCTETRAFCPERLCPDCAREMPEPAEDAG